MPIKEGHYIGNGEYAREDFIAARPELVQDLVRANVEAIAYIIDDPKGAASLWSKEIGFPVEVIDFSLSEGISVYSKDITPSKETVDAYTKFLKDAGILKPEDNPKVDASFAEKAMKM